MGYTVSWGGVISAAGQKKKLSIYYFSFFIFYRIGAVTMSHAISVLPATGPSTQDIAFNENEK